MLVKPQTEDNIVKASTDLHNFLRRKTGVRYLEANIRGSQRHVHTDEW